MKNYFRSFFLVLMIQAIIFASCSVNRLPGNQDISIEWEVISNQYDADPAVKARFVIENNSQFAFDDQNWTLFFNQSPRHLIGTDENSGVKVEHINSDWYRIIPLEGFKLLPGEKVEIIYENAHWWIKETDAPMGLYFVFIDKKGREKIVEVLNYKVLPFERPEQFTRHFNDHAPLPYPEVAFETNIKLELINKEDLLPIIPSPVSVIMTDEKISFSDPIIVYSQDGLEKEAEWLVDVLEKITSFSINTKAGSGTEPNSINLSLGQFSVQGQTLEAYRLNIEKNQTISIEGTDHAGLFYGMQSLIALFPVDMFLDKTRELVFPVLQIEDAPRFGYRGLHVDVSRNFQKQETIMKIMDLMAYYKLNTLHLHLTDDEGWRFEITALPELTAVGGHRGHTTMQAAALHPSYGSGPFPNAEGRHGSGFYSRKEYIEILKYANQRHIKVIPEINLPGHARAAIKAMEARYERFMALGDEDAANQFRLIDPDEKSVYLTAQLAKDNIVNVARESTYNFLEVVIDEVIDIYKEAGAPLDIVHIGGDEVPIGAWTDSPMVDELMEQLPDIGLHANMHKYFTRRALDIFSARNLQMAGWEEVGMYRTEEGHHLVYPGFAGGKVIPYAWNSLWGMQDLAYRFANLGYPVVLCHVTNFYLDLAYTNDPKEPGQYWGGFVDTRDTWHYNPFDVFKSILQTNMDEKVDPVIAYRGMERLRADARKNILGLQAQLWSETILGPEMLEYYVLPKLIGFAESAWAPERVWEQTPDATLRAAQVDKGWNVFANTIARKEFPRLSGLFGGFNYRVPPPGAIIKDGMLHANVEFPGLIVRYTKDGSEPDFNSLEYTGPVEVPSGQVNLKAFDMAGKTSATVTLRIE